MSYLGSGSYPIMTTVSGSATSWVAIVTTCSSIHKAPICWILPNYLGYAYTATGNINTLGSTFNQVFSSCCVPDGQVLTLYDKLNYLGVGTVLAPGGYPLLGEDNSAMSLKVAYTA